MRRALEKNVRELTVALGGSCTVDGGAGALGALGVTFRDGSGEAIETPIRGGDLQRITGVEIPESLVRAFAQIRLRIAVDVNNPLLGEQGAARTYGPQKGASEAAVARLEAGLANFARLLEQDPMVPGTGAAGGAPIGLKGVLGGVIEGGLDLVLDACDFDERCRRADLVLSGEGALDGQSRMGKAAVGVALRAQHHGVPAIAVVGSRREDFGEPAPFAGIIALDEHVPEQEAMAFPAASIMHAMETVLG